MNPAEIDPDTLAQALARVCVREVDQNTFTMCGRRFSLMDMPSEIIEAISARVLTGARQGFFTIRAGAAITAAAWLVRAEDTEPLVDVVNVVINVVSAEAEVPSRGGDMGSN